MTTTRGTAMTVYWNRADYRGVAHATEFRNALCGTPMGYGQFVAYRQGDRQCKRCVKIVTTRKITVTVVR